jgi:hypothetical protein
MSTLRRWLIVAITIECVIVAGMLHARGMFDHVGMDFLTTYSGAEMVASGRAAELYDTRAQWDVQRPIIDAYDVRWNDRVMHPYVAPPILALLCVPLLLLSPAAAFVVWSALNALCVAVAGWLLSRHLNIDWRLLAAILAGSMPLFYILLMGQIEGLLFLALVVFIIELRAQREVGAGLALAVFAIKPPLLLAPLLFLAVAGRRRALWTAVGATAVHAAASIALVGPSGVRDFIALSQRLSGPDGTRVTNVWGMVNVRSVVVRAFPPDQGILINLLIVALTALVLLTACWAWRRPGVDPTGLPSLALLAVTTVLTSYHALFHTATLALLGVALLVAHAARSGDLARANRLTVFSWLLFTALPLAYFVVVQSSKIPASIATIGVLLSWGFAAYAVTQSVPVAAPQTARARRRPQPERGRLRE